MSQKLVLGPLLSLENDNKYVVCFLSKTNQEFSVLFNKTEVKAQKLGNLKFGFLYRAEYIIPLSKQNQEVTYQIKSDEKIIKDTHDRNSWQFYIPAKDIKPRFAYESYENFMNSNLVKQEHEMPYSFLILNEFKLFDEEVYSQISEIKEWSKDNLDNFFEKLYIKKWNHKDTALALASIPNIIMWYDKDIYNRFDLLEKQFQEEDVYRNINNTSKKYFEIFQLRTIKNNTLLTKDRSHYSFALKFGDNQILALDDHKQSQNDIINNYLDNKKANENLLILCDKSTRRESL